MNINQISRESLQDFDAIVVGAGFAGATIARELAERAGKQVAVIESRDHVGGNAYDLYDEAGILIHLYGPHIFHTNSQRAYEYLSRFTEWLDYQHRVKALIDGQYVPVPFNKVSIRATWEPEKAEMLISKLIDTFGDERKVPIIQLRQADDPDLAELAEYVYQNVFLYYTMKQWGQTPEEVDPSVTARVPVFISEDDRYFQDTYQGMPKEGYTALFEKLLDHEGIQIITGLDAREVLGFQGSGDAFDTVTVNGQPYGGTVVYTGPLDELFDARFGRLPYRSLDFQFQTYDNPPFQPAAVVNYTTTEDFTRITEFTALTGQVADVTTIVREYPRAYEDPDTQIPYYAILNDENNAAYQRYADLVAGCKDFHLLGRLAEYRYYNMDAIVDQALALADRIC